MIRRGIRLARAHFIVTHRTNGKSPSCIALIGYQVFALLHGYVCFLGFSGINWDSLEIFEMRAN